MQPRLTPWKCGILGVGILLAAGCGGSEFAEVTGIVTMDGKPLPEAQVWFEFPGRRAALGITDSEGRYEVRYTGKQTGGVVGKNTVRVETVLWYEDGTPIPGALVVPLKYRENSVLSADVKPGSNTFNFDLEGGWHQ